MLTLAAFGNFNWTFVVVVLGFITLCIATIAGLWARHIQKFRLSLAAVTRELFDYTFLQPKHPLIFFSQKNILERYFGLRKWRWFAQLPFTFERLGLDAQIKDETFLFDSTSPAMPCHLIILQNDYLKIMQLKNRAPTEYTKRVLSLTVLSPFFLRPPRHIFDKNNCYQLNLKLDLLPPSPVSAIKILLDHFNFLAENDFIQDSTAKSSDENSKTTIDE